MRIERFSLPLASAVAASAPATVSAAAVSTSPPAPIPASGVAGLPPADGAELAADGRGAVSSDVPSAPLSTSCCRQA
jgi:hypothetical protein